MKGLDILEFLEVLFVRTPRDKLIYEWCQAKDRGDIDAWEEIEMIELEELEEHEGVA